jgi:hypothetical protein
MWQASAHLRQPIADAQVQRVAELHAGLRLVILDGHVRAVLLLRLLFQPVQDDLQIHRRKFLVVLLQELIDGMSRAHSVNGAMALANAAAPSMAPSP